MDVLTPSKELWEYDELMDLCMICRLKPATMPGRLCPECHKEAEEYFKKGKKR